MARRGATVGKAAERIGRRPKTPSSPGTLIGAKTYGGSPWAKDVRIGAEQTRITEARSRRKHALR